MWCFHDLGDLSESARLEKWRAVSTTPYMRSIGDLTMFIGITLRMRTTLRLLFGHSSCKLLLNRFAKLLAVTPQRGLTKFLLGHFSFVEVGFGSTSGH